MARVTLYYRDGPILSRMKDGVQYGWFIFMEGGVPEDLDRFERGDCGRLDADSIFKYAIFIADHDLLFWE